MKLSIKLIKFNKKIKKIIQRKIEEDTNKNFKNNKNQIHKIEEYIYFIKKRF